MNELQNTKSGHPGCCSLDKAKCHKTDGVAEKHDFRGIQRKIPQVSDFAKKQD
jgi:hypothetical protein